MTRAASKRPHHIDRLPIRAGVLALGVAIAAGVTGCGSDDGGTARGPASSPVATTDGARPQPTDTEPTPSTVEVEPTATSEATTTTVDDSWKAAAAEMCAAYAAEAATADDPSAPLFDAELVQFWRDVRSRVPGFETLDLPDELRTGRTDVVEVMRQADEYLEIDDATMATDVAAGNLAVERFLSLLEYAAALVTLAGAECGDTSRIDNASLNVPLPNAGQISDGFGSVWLSQGCFDIVVRVDPDSGEVLATIDVGAAGGSGPGKLQPADGRMIVRSADAYVAIDPTTNTVVDMLAKSDVGPAANRAWAIDGAMWICDGQRLHRYDPATFDPTGTVIELGIECGQVVATDDLVVAWTHNEDEGESGSSAAAFVDPATNAVLATTPLPGDVTVPIVLDDTVFFPANRGVANAVVDRATWAVTATPDYGREIGGSQGAFYGESIYLIADRSDVIVVDAQTYEQTGVLEPLKIVAPVNSLAITPGALWVATGDSGVLQRFDIP
jgi:hypothetical protein